VGGLLSAHRDVFDQVLKHFSMSARLRARHQKKNLKLQKSDAIILRYPKSGVTWLRVMISHIYWQRTKVATSEIIGSTEFEKIVPGAPRIFIGAPLSLTAEMTTAVAARKAILLLRDPRDIAVSLYFHMAKRSTALERAVYSIPSGFEEQGVFPFVVHPTYGMPQIIAFMNRWWPLAQGAPNSLVVRYENMRSDPAPVLMEVMRLLGSEPSSEELRASVEFASLEAMRERERNGYFRASPLRPGDSADENSYKVRKGEVGGFAQYLSDSELSEINALMFSTLDRRIGYV
jgi:hypothetical protein